MSSYNDFVKNSIDLVDFGEFVAKIAPVWHSLNSAPHKVSYYITLSKDSGGYISAKFSLNYCLIMVLISEIILTQNLSIVTLKC